MKILNFVKNNIALSIGITMLLLLLFVTFFGESLSGVDSELKEIDYIWVDNVPVVPPSINVDISTV